MKYGRWKRNDGWFNQVQGMFVLSLIVMGDLAVGQGRQPSTSGTVEPVSALLQQAREKTSQRKFPEAERLLTRVIALDKEQSAAFYARGRVRFQLGRIKQSVEDFDVYVKQRPQAESRQWERGIALYYAGEFKRGSQQFELYQTFHDNDVENSVWRFLCMARGEGVAKARKVMLPIKNDRRVPMMQVFEMYRGTIEPAAVLEAVHADKPDANVLTGRLFYAHLYLGLYHEAIGNTKEAEKYIRLAAQEKLKTNPRINTYMWDVARIHQAQLEKPRKPQK